MRGGRVRRWQGGERREETESKRGRREFFQGRRDKGRRREIFITGKKAEQPLRTFDSAFPSPKGRPGGEGEGGSSAGLKKGLDHMHERVL